jgi:3-oxoacyl-[acyl-carrier-protein] synthase-1
MAEDPVVVVAVGMMTAVGISAAETAASVRAAAMGFAETSMRDHFVDPFVLAVVPEAALPPLHETLATSGLTSRERRMLRLATLPLTECLAPLKKSVRPALMLSLPESETALLLEPNQFVRWLAIQCDDSFDPAVSDASEVGRAGGLFAIGRAVDRIQSGRASFALAGGVDTYYDLYVLAMLDVQKRVKSEVHLDGFIPGEGAGFVLLASESAARNAGLTSLGRISAPTRGFEAGHLSSEEIYRGDGLASAVQQLVSSGGVDLPIADVYSSMNGENHWAKEWGVSFIRNSAAFAADHGFHHPADCYGDTGAACGPLMVGLALLGLNGGYRRRPTMVYCSSDRGDRAALAIS